MLITNANIITMDAVDYSNGYILIESGKITDVGDMHSVPPHDDIFDAGGQYAVPGFIDAHCHLGLFRDGEGYDSEDANENSSPTMPHLRIIEGANTRDRAIKEAHLAGVTTVAISPGSKSIIGGQIAIISTYNGDIINVCAAIKAALGDNPKQSTAPNTGAGVAAMLREGLRQLTADGQSPAPCVHIHVHRADDILTALRIADELKIDIKLIHATEGYLIPDKLAGVPCLVGPLICDRSKPELIGYDDKNPAVLERHGVKIAMVSDHPELPSRHLLLCAQLAEKNGMSKQGALRAITVNAAEILGIDDTCGKIRSGHNADILIFNEHPMEFKSKITKIFAHQANS